MRDKVIATWISYPQPAHVIAAHGENWTAPENIVSSGPYRLDSRIPGEQIILLPNPQYYEPVNIPRIEVALNSDTVWGWEQYLLGNLDTAKIDFTALETIKSDPLLSAQLEEVPTVCTFGLSFNTSLALFSNVNVRRAFIAAVDRQALINDWMGGGGFPTQTLIPPTVFGAVDGPALGIGIPSSATQARQYLSNAGYPNGAGFPAVTVEISDSPRNRMRWDYLKNVWIGMASIGAVFRLDVTTPTLTVLTLSAGSQTLVPYMINIRYSPEQLKTQNISNPGTLALYAEIDGNWVEQSTTVEIANNQLSATTQEINTTFLVIGKQTWLYLPMIIR